MQENPIEKGARQVVQTLRDHGFTAYYAGGCVRDMLMGRTPKDFDIASDASPDEVIALFDRYHEIGKAFGVVQVMVGDEGYEVATFRQDMDYEDGRHPVGIVPSSPEEDAERRDFTINGMFFDPIAGEVIDFVGGKADLEKQIIRAIGDPETRFLEDHLRMLRAIRFSAVLGYQIDAATWQAMTEHAAKITRVSVERIAQELNRTLMESIQPGDALELLRLSGLLEHIMPELLPMVGCEQPPQYHPEGDVWTHTRIMLNIAAKEKRTLPLMYGILFHDIGKPATFKIGPGTDGVDRIRFDGHDSLGAQMAEDIMRRLKLPNDVREGAVTLVARHMKFMAVPDMRASTLRKFAGGAYFADEMELHRVDCTSSHGLLGNYVFMQELLDQYANEPVLPDPLVGGREIIALGVAPGPEVGRWKQFAFDLQLEDEALTRDDLVAAVQAAMAREA
ncbi:MAG: putative nucleotidyltransferase with HDIG domain [Kiritimatiellia bacterium]|jgi:putative nucleotidyltransferase with HDIG domain